MDKILPLLLLLQITIGSDGYSLVRNGKDLKSTLVKGVDLKVLKETYMDMFASPRSNDQEKEHVRKTVIDNFKKFGMETETQEFQMMGKKGLNLIGIRPGKNRKAGKKDSIIVVGSHYDSVSGAPGVDDNGSGSVAVVETARLLYESKADLDHTIIFVCHDLEENGLFGSAAFVNEWLVPKELKGKDTDFLGAYIIDMDMFYDPANGSQSIPLDVYFMCYNDVKVINDAGAKGDFTVTWMRAVDEEIMKQLEKEWVKTEGGEKYKLRRLMATSMIPPTFYRSDHASYWGARGYDKPLRAMLLTDMGPWRGQMANCYHSSCDDKRYMTDDNLNFLKTTIDALYGVLVNSPPAPLNEESLTKIDIPKFDPPANITEFY